MTSYQPVTHTVDISLSHLFTKALTLPSLPQAFIALGLALSCALLYNLTLYPYFFSPLRHVLGPPLKEPIVGHFGDILKHEAGIIQREWVHQYGGLVRAVGPMGVERLIVADPDLMKQVLVQDSQEYVRDSFSQNVLGILAGYGIFHENGEKHRSLRRALAPAFSIAALTSQTQMFYGPIQTLVDIWNERIDAAESSSGKPGTGTEVVAFNSINDMSLEIVCLVGFQYECPALTDSKNIIGSAMHILGDMQSGHTFTGLMCILHLPGMVRLINSEFGRKYSRIWGSIPGLGVAGTFCEQTQSCRRVVEEMVQKKIAEVENNQEDEEALKRKDVMSCLLRARKEEKSMSSRRKTELEAKGALSGAGKLTDKEVLELVLTAMMAGHDTTAVAITWAVGILAQHPDVQSKLRAEVMPLIEKDPHPSYKALQELPYLNAVVNESIRCNPSVPMSMRQAKEDQYLGGHFVPKGTLLYLGFRVAASRQEAWGDDYDTFNPDRWFNLPEGFNTTFQYPVFSAGARNCPGKQLALIQIKAALAVLLSNFEFELAYPGQELRSSAAITMKPKDNMPLRVKRLSTKH